MTFFAQTDLQLYTQLTQQACRREDLEYIHHAYNLALRLFSCLYRPNGKEHIAHAVGIASILCALQLRVQLIAAGLLHAAYKHGAFPSLRNGPTESNRNTIRDRLGEEAEELIFRYYLFPWGKRRLRIIQESIPGLCEVDKDVLLLRLVNDLENGLDLGVSFCPDVRRRSRTIEEIGPTKVDLARKLGYPALADQLAAAFDAILHSEIPAILRNGNGETSDFLQPPLSYRRRFRVWCSQWGPGHMKHRESGPS